ncbi:MSHA pilin protein MshC [Duganella sp. SG902]|uniref:pilus assembly FimT family protein n=1 Tax=Duganella sp. SG902 TaxID=2587016 RepID=UPI00159DF663|nr:MSHA pilin protein MshC [Duganella sp. SG902]
MNRTACRSVAGFTIVELVMVLVIMGILGAIGVSRFWDNSIFQNRAYADQARSIIRYAQKLAIAQNRPIFVITNGNSFAVCSGPGCAANELVTAPGGGNSGSAATRARCQSGGSYNAAWLCEGRPDNVNVAASIDTGGFFYFDAFGRPYNAADNTPGVSTFRQQLLLTFSSGGNNSQIIIWPETGYVQ